MTGNYMQVLRAEVGARRRDVRQDAPQRFAGRPDFLLEPDAAECFPFGAAALREAERRAQWPAGPLFYLGEERDETLAELSVSLVAHVGERCAPLDSLAVVAARSCLSEDVSTCLSSRVIDALGLSAQHSFSVLGELGSGWAAAIECAGALRHGEGAAEATLLIAAEKWRAPFRRAFGDLFALSDGLAAVLLGPQRLAGQACVALHGWASCAASIDAGWLHAPVAVDVQAWASAVEAGLVRIESALGIDIARAPGAVLGPTLGVLARDVAGTAPRLASLIDRQCHEPALPGHFGTADPFVRIDALLRGGSPADGSAVLAWSAGPGGDVSMFNGAIAL